MGSPLVDADWYAFCQALYKGIEGEDWEDMCESYKEMSRAVGVKKPQEAQKAKALWAKKSSQRQGGRFLRPGSQRQHFKKRHNAIGVVGRTSQGSNCCVGQSVNMR